MKPEDFEDTGPAFLPEEYFLGNVRAWGLFQDRSGAVKRQFVVDIVGSWDEDSRILTLDESFRYADGGEESRVWKIRKLGDHAYEGTAGDVIGKAEIKQFGQALNLKYDLRLKVKDSEWTLHFDDWLLRQDEDVVLNVAEVSKFGITVGRLSVFFIRQP